MSFVSWRSMVRLYCSAYCDFRCGANSPNNKIGRNVDQSTQPFGPPGVSTAHGVCGVWLITPVNGLGLTPPACDKYGRLNSGLEMNELPPKGGSALNCSKTSCSIGL